MECLKSETLKNIKECKINGKNILEIFKKKNIIIFLNYNLTRDKK